MESGRSMSSDNAPSGQACPECGQELASGGTCATCERVLTPDLYASAILSPAREPMDETLTSFLAAPLPEEALRKTSNPANLFGKYVFLREVGRGATGQVLKAWDTYLSRHVALKFLHHSAARNVELNDTERVQDFLREARLAARLHHPNIVQIHEVDCRDGRYYISMEFIDGGTLAERIHGPAGNRTRTLFYHEPQRFLELLRTISLAVHHAHRQPSPVVHRDLKPHNVLIDAHDKPYVADFGLANEVQVGTQDGGGVRGTPAYMAPEQALGRTGDIDPRTDVYSLGVILYEMLTGEVPFGGTNIPSVLRKIATDPPEAPSVLIARNLANSPKVQAFPVSSRDALEKICLKALAKNRDDRYQTTLEFADALASCLPAAKPEPAPPPARPAVSKSRTIVGTAVLGAALLTLLLVVLKVRGASAPAAPAPIAVDKAAPGDGLAQLASGYRASGRWAELQAAVDELRKKAPSHRRLAEFDAALAARAADVERFRQEWRLMLDRLSRGLETPKPADLRRRFTEAPEIEEELRSELRETLRRLETALAGEIQQALPPGPSNAWASKDLKALAGSLRDRVSRLLPLAEDPVGGIDPRTLLQGSALLDRVLAYQGTWNLRINLSPYSEFRIVDGETEKARDLTPALLRDLEIGNSNLRLELGWPSLREAKSRWSGALPRLAPGDTLVVSGDPQHPILAVEAP